jgi:hypothetical protein
MFALIMRSSLNVIPATPINNIPNIFNVLNLKVIIQNAISPLILEIKELKEEIK